MKLQIGNIKIVASTVEEIESLLKLVPTVPTREPRAVSVNPEKSTPWADKLREATGGKRFKVTLEDSARIETGEATREDIARERLEAMGIDTGEESTPVVSDTDKGEGEETTESVY